MKISIISLFPKMIEGFFNESIIRKASNRGLVEIEVINLRDFALDSYGTVDDRPYGGGAGMVLRVEPIFNALQKIKNQRSKIKTTKINQKTILTSAKGKRYNQAKAREYSKLDQIIIIAGHYEAVDERVLGFIDEEVSLGDFIMTGGEIPAAAICDSVVRLLPGVLKKEEATQTESFWEMKVEELIKICGKDEVLSSLQKKRIEKVQLLEYPHYTRPADFMSMTVPESIMKGNHQTIANWRIKQAYEQTRKKRPDLLDK